LVAGLDGCSRTAAPRPSERIIGLGFESVVDHADQLSGLARRLNAVNVNGVGISVGRTDWTAFPWHNTTGSPQPVGRNTRHDYVADAMRIVGADSRGRRRTVTAVVDTLVSGWIITDPSIAGVSATGQRSTTSASVTALAHGAVGDRVIAFVAEVCKRYRPHAVSLTELFFDTYTFGADDLASYRSATGAEDWPRTKGGAINTGHASIGSWRSAAVTSIVRRVRAVTRSHGVALDMEVRAPWANPASDRRMSGQNYVDLMKVADRLVVWDYFALNNRSPSYTKDLASALANRGGQRFVMSVGLWADHGTISAADLRTAIRASVAGGVDSVWVTPASLLSQDHWTTLRDMWS
jgi:hypothetical protein